MMDEKFFELAQQREEMDRAAGIEATRHGDGAVALMIDGEVCCCDCHDVIPEKRLQAKPDAARCIRCQERVDKRNSGYARRR